MAWQGFVDMMLTIDDQRGDKAQYLDQAAIFSAAGDSVWAATPGFQIAPAEAANIAASFTDTNDPKAIALSGVKVQGGKYMMINSDDKALILRKGREGLVCLKTNLAVLIAHHPDTVIASDAWSKAEVTQKYLVGKGY